ncbi:hypothetical protein MG293_010173 [Ovis ammon polii]|uniref:Uncharacterized protein n=1 Tax=Ovis ammon polii TaxID=230172 RepID=A0AAD4U3K4_OVIAM|nr:hypothetical protein MG293_010173 [Ovis ammon polii]
MKEEEPTLETGKISLPSRNGKVMLQMQVTNDFWKVESGVSHYTAKWIRLSGTQKNHQIDEEPDKSIPLQQALLSGGHRDLVIACGNATGSKDSISCAENNDISTGKKNFKGMCWTLKEKRNVKLQEFEPYWTFAD